MNHAADQPDRPTLDRLADEVLASYLRDPRTAHLDARPLPSVPRTVELLEVLRDLVFPGYFQPQGLRSADAADHVRRMLAEVRPALDQLLHDALAFGHHVSSASPAQDLPAATARITDAFLLRIPALREVLSLDVQAAYDGDPAARHTDETIYCYPGLYAVFVYRIAHELHTLGAWLLARLMTEHAHSRTGVDIHPGARIGHSFFIDHGTGVVIGETTDIGDHCKLYQGVTLGAMSFQRDEAGRLVRGTKRHPTLQNHVTIYANATILGGNTIIGHGSIIGGSVFITKSIPPGHYVTMKSQELKYRSAERHNRTAIARTEKTD